MIPILFSFRLVYFTPLASITLYEMHDSIMNLKKIKIINQVIKFIKILGLRFRKIDNEKEYQGSEGKPSM